MSIRVKDGRHIVEIYDPITKKKKHVKPSDYGMEPPRSERQAQKLERAALNARDSRRPGIRDETIGSFAERWPTDYDGEGRGESTRKHNAERVKAFREKYAKRTLRSISRDDARAWAKDHPGTVMVLCTMFNDALNDRLCEDNPFSRLGIKKSKGREDITVLTTAEVDQLAEIALAVHGPKFGREMAAFIKWQAYTCMRPGESFAARWSLLDGDVYHLRKQFNSALGKETAPKHGGVGEIYVPEPALEAVQSKPRVLGEDLMFVGKRGQQMRQEAMSRWWSVVRAGFMAALPIGHHLHQRLAVDPEDTFDLYELRHAGASYMLNELGIEPWVIAKQLRHSDDGALVVKLYGHPTRKTAIDRLRKAFTATKPAEIGEVRAKRAKGA